MSERNDKFCLKERLRNYALKVVDLYTTMPKDGAALVIGRQLLRSGTSVGAHYREACRARSPLEFISKIEGGLQELDESDYWLDLLLASNLIPQTNLTFLIAETSELMAMMTASAKTAKGNLKK